MPSYFRPSALLCALIVLGGCALRPHRNTDSLVRALKVPPKVEVSKDARGDWRLFVNGEPFLVKGVNYEPARVGHSPDPGYPWPDWTQQDADGNGRADWAYDAWVDADRNNLRGPDEATVGDFALMKRMGVNAIRWYHNRYPAWISNKDILRDLAMTYGIRVAVGDLFGAYEDQKGYAWNPGTDYTQKAQRLKILASVRRMVMEHKDEPYVFLWLLGSDNNWARSGTNAALEPEAYASLLQEAARLIHKLDDHRRPVALVNADLGLLQFYAALCPEVDIFGVNVYRGSDGFGPLWAAVKQAFDRPVLVTEYGGYEAPGYDEDAQAAFHESYWKQIVANTAGAEGGEGNAIGGFASDWVDVWWTAGIPFLHQAPGTHLYYSDDPVSAAVEYQGICSQGDGGKSPFLRQLRKVYSTYQSLWAEPEK